MTHTTLVRASRWHKRRRVCWGIAAVVASTACAAQGISEPATSVSEFEQRLRTLQERTHIAGVSAVIARGQQVVWSRGFGLANIASNLPVVDTTVFHLASLTKPFASAVLLQLVEEGKVSLDDPVSKYNITLPGTGTIRVRHLLSHTSEGTPGTRFQYNGDRFGLLDSVIARASGMSFAAALQQRIIAPLSLTRTVPNAQSTHFNVSGHDRNAFVTNIARGYSWSNSSFTLTQYPTYFGTAAGLMASALDVAAFSMALDRDAVLEPASKTIAFAPVQLTGGAASPYALGWFSTNYKGVNVVWHYGYWTANSSLIIKVPSRSLTFVLLANTDGLSSRYELGAGKLESSPWAREFLDAFVIGKAPLP